MRRCLSDGGQAGESRPFASLPGNDAVALPARRTGGRPVFRLALLGLFALSLTARADITATWDGATSTWNNAAHWSTNPAFPNNSGPNLYDTVVTAGAVTLNQNITINQFALSGGALDSPPALTDFTLTALEGLQWTGGAIRGNGTLALGTAGPTTITGGGAPLVLSGRTIDSSGTATFTAGTIRGGSGAIINNLAGATFTALGQAAFFADTASPLYTFNNAGTFVARSTTGAGFTSMDAVFNNTETVRVELAGLALTHTLSLAGGGTDSGLFVLGTGTALELGGVTTLQGGTTFTGGGTVFVAGEVAVAGSISAENLKVAVGELNIGSNLFTISGSGEQSGGVTRVGGGGTLRVNGIAGWVMDDGTLTGPGTLDGDLDAQGIIAPGSGPGTLRITGDAIFGVDAQLSLEIGGTGAGSFDILTLDGEAFLDGQIAVTLTNGFVPGPTATFQVLTATGGSSGAFRNAAADGQRFATADGLGSFEIDYRADSVVLTAFIPEPSTALLALVGASALLNRRRTSTPEARH